MAAQNTVLMTALILVVYCSSELSYSMASSNVANNSTESSGSGSGGSGSGSSTTDVSACDQQPRPCHRNAECIVAESADGGYICECVLGYTGDGKQCTELPGNNEFVTCESDSQPCDANAQCSNTEDGVYCECREGFLGNGMECTDIDECSMNADDCHQSATCINRPGGFECDCIFGYKGNGTHCSQHRIQIIAFACGTLGGLVLIAAVIIIDVYLCKKFSDRNREKLRRHHERLKQQKEQNDRFLQQRGEHQTAAYQPNSNRQRSAPNDLDDSTVFYNPSAPGIVELNQQTDHPAPNRAVVELRIQGQQQRDNQNRWSEALRINEWLI